MKPQTRHGFVEHRGMMDVSRSRARDDRVTNRFGELFPSLEGYKGGVKFLRELGEGIKTDAGDTSASSIPAGFAFFGQFLTHDLTFDSTSRLDQKNDPTALRNFRTPALDLDSMYGSGRRVDSYLYEHPRQGDADKLLIGDGREATHDLPRNAQGRALIGDVRNDENRIISQMHVAFLRFHNEVVDYLKTEPGAHLFDPDSEKSPFERAAELVRWHYQWVVLEEYLPLVCRADVLTDIRRNEPRYYRDSNGTPFAPGNSTQPPFIPVEFAAAAYRFGHSQIKNRYIVNEEQGEQPLFEGGRPGDLSGLRPVDADQVVEWEYFVDVDESDTLQFARSIDTHVAESMFEIPFLSHGVPVLNLLRGKALNLPSGQAVAREVGAEILSNRELGLGRDIYTRNGQPTDTEAPLWYYVLGEAEVTEGGERLGEVGSRIVGEVFSGLVAADPSSYLSQRPGWEPVLPTARSPEGRFSLADLLTFEA
jgi:hypothetical protein